MGQRLGTRYDNPRFALGNGVIFDLKPVSGLLVQRYQLEWEQSHPVPVPETVKLANGDPWKDVNAPDYQLAVDLWTRLRNDAVNAFTLKAGIQNRPPKGWVNEWDVAKDEPIVAWIYGQIVDTSDLEDLINAILGLTNATEDGIREAEKN